MNDVRATKRDCLPATLQRRRPGGVSTASEVKRLCIRCTKLYSPGDVAYVLPRYECTCVGCDAAVSEAHEPTNAGSDFQRRIES